MTSDLIRLLALREHGGVWLDASIIVTSEDWKWLFEDSVDTVVQFTGEWGVDGLQHRFPALETWYGLRLI